MMQKIQRFGGAMFTPVLLLSFSGIMVALAVLFKNPDIMGSLAVNTGMWYKFWHVVQEGAWTVFRQIPLLFVIGLPIGLAKHNHARATLESLTLYITFNYFIAAILNFWGPSFGVDYTKAAASGTGLTMITNIKTLDTGMLGALIVAGIVVYLHNKYFDTNLPDWLGVFKGSSFVYIVGFFVMLPLALVFCLVWPLIQNQMGTMQNFLKSSGVLGVWVYTFLERILIPTGLHHFIYTPFTLGPAAVPNGLKVYWIEHLKDFATSSQSLKSMFPQGGFTLYGMSKVFAAPGIALAMWSAAKPEKKKVVAGLLIPATLTAMLSGVTEPLEFTFLFVAPVLFLVHALLAATLAATAYALGVVGLFSSGLIDWLASNWLPLFKYHPGTYLIQIGVGLAFTAIYYFVFRYLIVKYDFKTPGRTDDNNDDKLYTKADYKAKKAGEAEAAATGEDARDVKARLFLEALGGKENIAEVTNCATRLRVSVKDESKVKSAEVFVAAGAHGLVHKGKAIQVIVGLSVPQVRERFENLLK